MARALLFPLFLLLTVASLAGLRMSVGELEVPVRQETLHRPRVFAYRGWQSMGVHVDQEETLRVRAKGSWLYTPGEYHGPRGHARYTSPGFYPLPGVPGGALIGRIGEDGRPFYVGEGVTKRADRTGILYLRIDDDLLGDNDGWVTVEVTVEKP